MAVFSVCAVANVAGSSGTITPDRIGARYARAAASVENVPSVICPAAVFSCTRYLISNMRSVRAVYVKAAASFFGHYARRA